MHRALRLAVAITLLAGCGQSGTGAQQSGGATGRGGSSVASGGAGGTTGTGGSTVSTAVGAGGRTQPTGGNQGGGGIPASGSDAKGGSGGSGAGGIIASGGNAKGGSGGNGTGGVLGTGGAGTGGSHPPSCSSFPTGSSFTTPTDGLLHCYWIHSDATDWSSSESRCVSEGGTLATILSSQENMFVLQILLQGNLFKGDGVSLGATDGKSSSDKNGAGQYAWVTGEPWAYINWHQGQPSGTCTCLGFGSTTCACDHWLAIFNDGTWHDVDGSSTRPSLCEAVAR